MAHRVTIPSFTVKPLLRLGLARFCLFLTSDLFPVVYTLIFIMGFDLWLGRDGSPDLCVSIVQVEESCT